MEEIITKGNLDTYTQGLKGVLSSMGEAILDAKNSSGVEYIKEEYVDLGLPSGLLWAKGNIIKKGNQYKIGEEYEAGGYASWGNVDPHFDYEAYNWGSSNTDDSGPYASTRGSSGSFTNTDENSYEHTPAYDIVCATLGVGYLPTAIDYLELYDNTDLEYTSINNVNGIKFMKKTDHSVYVFFPACGYGNYTSFSLVGINGYYLTSSLYSSSYGYAFSFVASGNIKGVTVKDQTVYRYCGCSIRSIRKPYFNVAVKVNPLNGLILSNVTIDLIDSKLVRHLSITNSKGVAEFSDVCAGLAEVLAADYGFTPHLIDVGELSKSFTLNAERLQYAYIKLPMSTLSAYQDVIISETLDGTPQTLNVQTGIHENPVMQALRSSSHLYMGKCSNETMVIRLLKDDDGTKYADDNSTANMDGSDGDHFLRINKKVYIRFIKLGSGYATFCIAIGGSPAEGNWHELISPNDLLGVHEATAAGSGTYAKLRSISGGKSTYGLTYSTAKQNASNTGNGFSLVTWEWHCMMALLFYGWYGHRNAASLCGRGSSSYDRTLGTKDYLGMIDTTSSNGNTDNTKFWGLENWWGGKYEFLDNIALDNNNYFRISRKDGTYSSVYISAKGSSGTIYSFYCYDGYLDFLPSGVVSSTELYYYSKWTGYSSITEAAGLLRSGSGNDTLNGPITLACPSSNISSYYMGSRLAFRGHVENGSTMKLRFKTPNGSSVEGAIIKIFTPTGEETHTTDANGEIKLLTANGTCTITESTHELNITQFEATSGGGIVDFIAIEKPLTSGYIIMDQTTLDPTKIVIDENGNTYSNYSRPEVITKIRQMSHCYVGTYSDNKMYLLQLDDHDTNLYANGTDATSDISNTYKNVFMRLPFFFTRVSEYATDKIKIEFAIDEFLTSTTTRTPAGDGWKQWGGNDLIGKYKGQYITGSGSYRVCSSSGVTPSTNSYSNFKLYHPYNTTLVKLRHHNIMAILFYAYYGHTNCLALIGVGRSGSSITTGECNSYGMSDTVYTNSATSIVFWGLENWWGNVYEWIDNVSVTTGVWTITEDDGTTRTLTAGVDISDSTGSYTTKLLLGDNLDVIFAGTTSGSSSTGYCDIYRNNNTGSSYRVRRSGYGQDTESGVACLYVVANNTTSSSGARIAYTGPIEIV